jgi:hypothetical protein
MATAFVVTLEKNLPEPAAAYAKADSGRALAREADRLSSAARRCGVENVTDMLSESEAVVLEQMRETGFDVSKMRVPPELWFPAEQGLKTVRALAKFVEANLNDFKQPNPILRDLKAAEAILSAAEAGGVRFHFSKVDLPSGKGKAKG